MLPLVGSRNIEQEVSMEPKFLVCKRCGNIVAVVKASGAPVSCCGEPMSELVAGSVDAAKEKHVPVIAQEGDRVTVTVGSVAHPMAPEHFIEWILLSTTSGNQRKLLKPGDAPVAVFALSPGEQVVSAYAYCNLHGLWRA